MKRKLNDWEVLALRLRVSAGWLPVLVDPRNWFNEERRYRSLIYHGARKAGYSAYNAEFLVKQSNLETGFQELGFYTRSRNLFGMHKPNVRTTVNAGSVNNEIEGGEMLVYNSHVQSIVDRILWDKYHSIDPKSETYDDDVQSFGYNPSSTYAQNVGNTDTALSTLQESFHWLAWLLFILLVVIGYRIIRR